MRPRAAAAVNYALYQGGWFAAVLGAASGHATAGAVAAALLVAAHFVLTREPRREAALLVLTLVTGASEETWQLHAGTYRLLGGAPAGPVPPVWLLLLWAQFATTFRYALHPLLTAPRSALIFGAVGGPLAFLAGDRLGAVALATPLALALLRIAVGWTLALAVFAWVVRRWAGDAPGRYRRLW